MKTGVLDAGHDAAPIVQLIDDAKLNCHINHL